MKAITLFLALIVSVGMYAQDIKPTYEKEGDMVKATYFHDNGTISQTGYFVEGKLHGKWKMYNETGKKIAMGQYDNGVRTGKWFFWKEEALKEVDYANNKIANVVEWKNSESIAVNK